MGVPPSGFEGAGWIDKPIITAAPGPVKKRQEASPGQQLPLDLANGVVDLPGPFGKVQRLARGHPAVDAFLGRDDRAVAAAA